MYSFLMLIDIQQSINLVLISVILINLLSIADQHDVSCVVNSILRDHAVSL